MNDALSRGAWAKGYVDGINLIIRHSNYQTTSFLAKQWEDCVNKILENTRQHVVKKIICWVNFGLNSTSQHRKRYI